MFCVPTLVFGRRLVLSFSFCFFRQLSVRGSVGALAEVVRCSIQFLLLICLTMCVWCCCWFLVFRRWRFLWRLTALPFPFYLLLLLRGVGSVRADSAFHLVRVLLGTSLPTLSLLLLSLSGLSRFSVQYAHIRGLVFFWRVSTFVVYMCLNSLRLIVFDVLLYLCWFLISACQCHMSFHAFSSWVPCHPFFSRVSSGLVIPLRGWCNRWWWW